MNTPRLVFAFAVCLALVAGCDRDPPPSNNSARSGAGRPSATPPQAPNAPASDAEVEAKVIEIVAEQMGVKASELKRSTHLERDLKADDLDRVELVMELEDNFDMSISDQDAEKFFTIGNLIDYVRSHRGTASKRPLDAKAAPSRRAK
jgi:acyl carrier protein